MKTFSYIITRRRWSQVNRHGSRSGTNINPCFPSPGEQLSTRLYLPAAKRRQVVAMDVNPWPLPTQILSREVATGV